MMTGNVFRATRDAWGYLLDSVSTEHDRERAGDKASYYMANGTPPGIWAGAGLAALGLSQTSELTRDQLEKLFGEGVHPLTGSAIGRKWNIPTPLEQRIEERIAQAAATPENWKLDPAEVEQLFDQIRTEEMERPVPQSVAGFEFVFSPPKSVSAWWALADPELKDEIRQAHHAAIQATIKKLETDVVRTRVGTDGAAQAHVAGINAALFDHWDSREGDPQLHTHMLVSNRVQGEDGRWRTIDSRHALMPAIATAGAYYDTVLMDELSARFGVEWTVDDVSQEPEGYRRWLVQQQRADSPAARQQFAIDQGTGPGSIHWQIDGIPESLVSEYSTRAKQVRSSKDQMIRDYVEKHGRQPSNRLIIKMRQQATLQTRKAKQHRSLRDLTQSWRHRARKHVGDSFLFADRIKAQGAERVKDYPLWSFRQDDVDDEAVRDAAEFVLHHLAIARATWGRRNAETEALRGLAGWRFRSPEDRDAAVQRVVDVVLSQAIPLTPKNPTHTPFRFHTADGENMFHPQTRDLFTTREVWDAEERLIAAGHATHGVRVDAGVVDQLVGAPTLAEHRTLGVDQAAAVQSIATSGRLVDLLVGPAGAGKTTSLEKLREIWEAQHGAGSVRGLAPTARAAEVLAESLGIQTENTAKWLHETGQGTKKRDGFDYRLRAGDLMIVDEASIAGTIALDQLRAQAEAAGAKLLLVGDWAQLAAVDAGGAFGLLATSRDDVPELEQLHRFKADWEADASKLLRLGKTAGLDPYLEHDRISWGLDETIVHDAVEAWKVDETTQDNDGDPLVSLLIAPTNEMVERLNQVARDWRISQGQVDAGQEAAIASGVASPGDRIVTRQNARTLRTDHDRWVKNNDEWTVVDVLANGDVVATAGEERVVLPADYCAEHVQLAYATTAHRSQGRTVDTAHTIVDSSASRETFYVAMTRGKLSNRAYVVADEDSLEGNVASLGMSRTWRETLDRVVMNRGGDIAAHDTLHDEAERIGSIRQLAAEYQTLVADQLERDYLPVLADLDLIDPASPDSPYLGPVLANLRRLEQHGAAVPETVPMLLARRETDTARDVLAVLHHRLASYLADLPELQDSETGYAPMLDELGVDVPDGWRSQLRLYRTLDYVAEQTGQPVVETLREQLLTVDRTKARDVAGLIAARLQRDFEIPDEALKPEAQAEAPRADLIAGLIEPAPAFGDPDFERALEDRAAAIQLRAELLVDRAIADGAPWLAELGDPIPGREADWRRRAVTVACYRDQYGVDTDDALGREHAYARNRERDRQIAAAALADRTAPVFEQHTPATPRPEAGPTFTAAPSL